MYYAGGCGPVLQQRMLLLWGKQVPETILTDALILDIAEDDISWTQVYIHVHKRLVRGVAVHILYIAGHAATYTV